MIVCSHSKSSTQAFAPSFLWSASDLGTQYQWTSSKAALVWRHDMILVVVCCLTRCIVIPTFCNMMLKTWLHLMSQVFTNMHPMTLAKSGKTYLSIWEVTVPVVAKANSWPPITPDDGQTESQPSWHSILGVHQPTDRTMVPLPLPSLQPTTLIYYCDMAPIMLTGFSCQTWRCTQNCCVDTAHQVAKSQGTALYLMTKSYPPKQYRLLSHLTFCSNSSWRQVG